jgi:anti-anti-sigma regulatory factor
LIPGSRQSFREHVRQQFIGKPVGVVIDCARSEYVDSSGLGLPFSLGKEARQEGIGYCRGVAGGRCGMKGERNESRCHW